MPDRDGCKLDVGHSKVNGYDWRAFVEQFGNRITVVHLHDNDGIEDQHQPLPEYEMVVETIDAAYNVFEMKSVSDRERNIDTNG
jgi:sugar phosphate isomerase/epimerase